MTPVGADHESRCHFHERAQELPRTMAQDIGDVTRSTGRRPRSCRSTTSSRRTARARSSVHALEGVTAAIWPGETLGLVGESGSGKTTLARTVLGLVCRRAGPSSSTAARSPAGRRRARREQIAALQIIFQNPDAALNRRHTTRRMLRRTLQVLANVTGKPADDRDRAAGRRRAPADRAP